MDKRRAYLQELCENGIDIPCFDGILIDETVRIGKGTVILPGTILRKSTVIGENCVIGPNSLLEDSIIGEGCRLNTVQCYASTVGSNVTVGPFCHIRPGTVIGDGVHIGDFVELKNSTVGERTHIAHLSYVGDSDVGARVNFGCGIAVANYNGVTKHRCVIEDDVFLGCNTNLVAPVRIGKGGYTAAGSTITRDVPSDALAIARMPQINKEGYNSVLRGGRTAKKAEG